MAKSLTAIQIAAFTKPGACAVGKAPGLYLRISSSGTKSWTLRTTLNGKRIERGLGGYPAVTLAQARQKALEVREQYRIWVSIRKNSVYAGFLFDTARIQIKGRAVTSFFAICTTEDSPLKFK